MKKICQEDIERVKAELSAKRKEFEKIKFSSLEEITDNVEVYNNNDEKDTSKIPEFYGYPFSYFYHYKKNCDNNRHNP